MEQGVCPFCERRISDLLRHFLLDHEIDSIDKFSKRLLNVEMEKNKKNEFSKFIIELNDRLRKKEITGEEFRELSVKWWRDHK